ncbi:MAG: ATP-binding cassette domain-containing protein [Alphaproteobacteria bacterium]|jgi:cell division transport system ATP-binding protein|nr:ATP-binding cassette domain-containing protein [Alphaproteobacteria bacterium]
METKNLITFENVGLRYGLNAEVLKDINFQVNEGDFIFLGGESGAGKSTLLSLMNLSILPSRGFLSVLGKDVQSLNSRSIADIRRHVGIIFQDFRLINHLNIFDNIALPLLIENIDKAEIEERVSEILDWIGLKSYAKATPLSLSGGQQQRVAVARSIIKKPILILADEPTGSIDNQMANRILLMLEELNSQGMAVIFATHNSELLDSDKHRLAVIKNKRLELLR